MQKGSARSAAVLQGVFPNGAHGIGLMGQNLFLEEIRKETPFSPVFKGKLSILKLVSCLSELCSFSKRSVLDAESVYLRHCECSLPSEGLATLMRTQYQALE